MFHRRFEFDLADAEERNNVERAMILAFVMPERRERLLQLLASRSRRWKALRQLDHFRYWDGRFLHQIEPNRQSPSQIHDILLAMGAKSNCWLTSADTRLDSKRASLREALAVVVGCSMGTLVSCAPGQLGYYEGEDAGERYVLARLQSP
jgi:hypothetical protein